MFSRMEVNSPESGFDDINDLLKDDEAPFSDLDLGFVMEENTAQDYMYDGLAVNDKLYSKSSDQEKPGPVSPLPSCRYYNSLQSPDYIYSSARASQREFSYDTLGEKEIVGDAGNSHIQYDENVQHEDSELYDSYLHDSIFQIDSETILNDINNDVSAHSEDVVSVPVANRQDILDKSMTPAHGEVIADIMQNKQAQLDSAPKEADKEFPVAQTEMPSKPPATHLRDPEVDNGNISEIKTSSSGGEVFDPSRFCPEDNVTYKELYPGNRVSVNDSNLQDIHDTSPSPAHGEVVADPINHARSESVPREKDEDVPVPQTGTFCNPSGMHLGYPELDSGNTNEKGNTPSRFEEIDPSHFDPGVNGTSMELYRTLNAHSEVVVSIHDGNIQDVYDNPTSPVQVEVISDAFRNKQVHLVSAPTEMDEEQTEMICNPPEMQIKIPEIDNGNMNVLINSLSGHEEFEPSHFVPEENGTPVELYGSPSVREDKSSGFPVEHQVISDSNMSITQTPFPIKQDEHQVDPDDDVMGQSPTFYQKDALAKENMAVSGCVLELPYSNSDESNKHDSSTHESHPVELLLSGMKCYRDMQGPDEMSSSPSKIRELKCSTDENFDYESRKVSALRESQGRPTSSRVSKKRYLSEETYERKRRRSSVGTSPSAHRNCRIQNLSSLEENLMEPSPSRLVMEKDDSSERADRNKRFGSNDSVGRRHSLSSSAKYSPAPPDKYNYRHEYRHRRRSRSPSRRKEFSSGYKRGNQDRYRSRSPHRRLISPRVRCSRSRSPLGHQSLRNAPRRSHWSPPHNRNTGIGKPGRNLFIAGFNFITTERDLERKFSRFGRVRNVRIVRDKRSGDSRGFGFLTLEKDEQADAAIRALDKSEWGGRIVLVEKTKTQLI